MTTLVEAREALIAMVPPVAKEIGMQVFWENRAPPPLDQIKEAFLYVEVDFNVGYSASIGTISGNDGVLVLALYSRVGEGVVVELSAADALEAALAHKFVGGVNTAAMNYGSKTTKSGWRRTEWLIPFSFYRL